jgi:hypothetical protein
MFFLLFILIISTISCPVSRDQILGCIRTFMDPDNDGIIQPETIDSLMTKATCLPKSITNMMSGAMVLQMCDINRDGSLTMADWTAPNACVMKPNHLYYACTLCEGCGYQFQT